MTVTVAIPVLNGGPLLGEVLEAVRAQEVDRELEVLVCDSGSRDGSPELARSLGARVITTADFGHGRTRNLLVREARGEHVAFLTQDATPADDHWLARLLAAFDLAEDVAVACGPYLPRPDAPAWLRREYAEWFGAMAAPGGGPRVVRQADLPAGPSPLSFHTDANGILRRDAWERVPFRDVEYAEDQRLALDLLDAGYAKAFVPDAGVLHSHHYSPLGTLRRTFDEFRALHEVYGHRAALAPRAVVGRARAEARRDAGGFARHLARGVGAGLGSRADRIPAPLRRMLSAERRT